MTQLLIGILRCDMALDGDPKVSGLRYMYDMTLSGDPNA